MGRNKTWTIQKIRKGFEQFYAEHGHYPVATEIDQARYLPSSRQIQRRFPGGLPELRKTFKLGGQTDYTRGAHSSQRAKTIGERAHKLEKEVYDYLVERFGKVFVHREYFFTDDKRTRSDFYVYCEGEPFCVDVFYPKDKVSFLGCLNSKMRTYTHSLMLQTPVVFLMMNDEIAGETITKVLSNKKNPLPKSQQVMTFAQFKEYCAKRKPMKKPGK
jgi:hypothetical protein